MPGCVSEVSQLCCIIRLHPTFACLNFSTIAIKRSLRFFGASEEMKLCHSSAAFIITREGCAGVTSPIYLHFMLIYMSSRRLATA